MPYIILGAVALGLLVLFARHFVSANPADLARQVKLASGLVLTAAAIILAIGGRWGFALPLAGFALPLLGLGRRKRAQRTWGQVSRVRTAMLEMELDHDSGDMRGRVIAGAFEGATLDGLSESDLTALWQDCAADGDSRALLEAYFDRRNPGWRESFDADQNTGQGAASGSGAMTMEEAYQILGLSRGAGASDVREAHKRLMIRLHPDHGGSNFLAAKINQAKDMLLGAL